MKQFLKCALLSCLVSMFLFDTAMGQQNAESPRFTDLQVPTGTMLKFANFSADGKKIIACGNKTARAGSQIVNAGSAIFMTWDAQTGRELRRLELEGDFSAFSPDGKKVATVFDREDLRIRNDRFNAKIPDRPTRTKLWDADSGQELQNLDGKYLTFLPDGKKIALEVFDSESQQFNTRIVDADTGCELRKLEGQLSHFSQDGRRIVMSHAWSSSRHTRILDANTGQELRDIEESFYAFSPDGKKIATGIMKVQSHPQHSILQILDADSERELGRFEDESVFLIKGTDFSSDGKIIAMGVMDNQGNHHVRILDAGTVGELRRFEGALIGFSPDGGKIATLVDRTVHIRDANSGHVLQRILLDQSRFSTAPLIAFARFSPDGKKIFRLFPGFGLILLFVF